MKSRPGWQRLALISFACLGGLVLLPSTGWIVRQQMLLGALLLPPRVSSLLYGDHSEQRRAEVARQHPDDIGMQIGYAGSNVQELETLGKRYGSAPAVQAAILRALASQQMNLDSRATDGDKIVWPKVTHSKNRGKVTVETRQLWEEAAILGERGDPTNGFFSYLHAVSLFAAHQDDAACAEIVRAGNLPYYNEYVRVEIEGRWRLADAANRGESGSLPKLAIQSAELEPHYSLIGDAARLAIVHAISLEQAGHVEEGFAIRRAVERFGARMRTDSTVQMGNEFGSSLCAEARLRPGGAPAILSNKPQNYQQHRALVVASYIAYLRKIGHPEEIAWIEHDSQTPQILAQISKRSIYLEPYNGLIAVAALWAVSAFLFGNLLCVLISGGIAALLCRSATVRNNARPKPLIRVAIVLASLCYLAYCALPVLQTYLGASRSQALVALTSLTIVPQFMSATISFRNRKRKLKDEYTDLRSFAANALPVATVLVQLYIPMLLILGRCEANRLDALRQITRHEGRAYARMIGQDWPTFGPNGQP